MANQCNARKIKNMKSKITLTVLIILVVAAGIIYTMYNKPHRNIANEIPSEQISAKDLFEAFNTNETEANTRFLDKTLVVQGVVVEKSENPDGSYHCLLESDDMMFGISCFFDSDQGEAFSKLSEGDELRIKGLCTGFTSDVVLNHSTIIHE
jgi:hypothetical protein